LDGLEGDVVAEFLETSDGAFTLLVGGECS